MKQAKEFFLRRIAAVLAILMVVFMFPVGTPAMATETVPQEEKAELAALAPEKEVVQIQGTTADGLEYEVYSSYVSITNYDGYATSIVIPDEIEGLPVKSISWWAFRGCSNLTSVTLPSCLETIGERAFSLCGSLKRVDIPASVTQIGYAVFEDSYNLEQINVDPNNESFCDDQGVLYNKDKTSLICCPGAKQGSYTIAESATIIAGRAFSGCKNLTSITLPTGLANIASYTFENCRSLTGIRIPDSVTTIGENAFSGCSSMTYVVLPDGLETIDEAVFYECASLSSISIPSTVSYIGGDSTWGGAFEGCSSLKSITLPSALEYIGSAAFRNCSSLQSINIPSGVTYIANGVFYGCSSMASIQVDSGNTTYASNDGILYNKEMTELLYCPDNKQGSVTIPSGVIEISGSSFENCDSLTGITIPNSVTSIGWSAFRNCRSLTSINIPNGVTSINSDTFNSCGSLTSISIPSGVVSIGTNAFYNCTSLASVSIPDGMRDIYGSAFSGCSSLKTISIPDTVTYLGAHAFDGCSSLASFTMPEGESGISKGTFNGCSNLKEITIHEGVTWISYYSFVGCDSLSDVYYGGSRSGWKAISIGSEANEDLLNATIHYAKPDVHDTLEQLTEEDYMLFSILAYRDLSGMLGDPTSNPVKEPKTIGEYYASKWDKVIPSSDGDLGHLKATYAQVFGGISNWFPTSVRKESNGFGATIFGNATGDYVIAYCGSLPPNKWFDQVLNAGNDWLVNDLPMELFDIAGPQVSTAIGLYESVSSTIDRENIAVTGHSLGGGLGNIVSAYSGCKGVTFNAITCLDTAYDTMPGWMGWEFDGVDKWNFVDHVNENDALAGKFEAYGDIVPLKPYIEHDNRFGTWDLGANHGMGSFITTGNDSYPALTAEVGEYRPNQVLTHMLRGSVLKLYVELGTSRNDSIKKGLDTIAPIRAYGGDGADKIYTSSRADYLIGGRGDDVLDGSYGDDNYLYYKGDGLDFIYDISGDDILYLYGFSESDTISAVENPDSEFIVISCNGQAIAKISKNNREYSGLLSGDSFKVKVTINGNQETINLTELFNTHKAGYRLIVGCPVHVEVLDSNENVVYTLTDGEVGSWYTDYGNFYVFEEENGEYGKVLDLIEGYTARIVGAGEGTMDVTYQVPVDGELSEPVSVSNVPVTEDLTATIEETEDGDVYLVIDEDSDGEADSERKLYGECPFTDVPEGSFYYEPVMWAVEEGITNGATETTYNPNGTCLRAQVVTFLHRADGNPAPTSNKNPFTDVKSTDFFYQPVLWAVEKGITNGVSATAFGSYANCNRAAVVTFLWRAAGSPEPESTSNPFVDVKTTDFFYKPVLWAVENGITNGVDATHFGPATDCNRAQVVTFLYRAFT